MDNNFGTRLKTIRMNRELSIEELAQETGVTAAAIERFERRGSRPTRSCVCELARALHVLPSVLLNNGARYDKQ